MNNISHELLMIEIKIKVEKNIVQRYFNFDIVQYGFKVLNFDFILIDKFIQFFVLIWEREIIIPI